MRRVLLAGTGTARSIRRSGLRGCLLWLWGNSGAGGAGSGSSRVRRGIWVIRMRSVIGLRVRSMRTGVIGRLLVGRLTTTESGSMSWQRSSGS